MSFSHTFRVRYVDCDAQRVMHNANYLAYADDVFDCWLRSRIGDFDGDHSFDFMVKRAVVTWQSPAHLGDEVDCSCRVSRWGTTSFDVEIAGRVGEREVFVAQLTQVSVVPGQARAVAVPDFVRAALDAGVAEP